MTEETTPDIKVLATMIFVDRHSSIEVAEFIVNLQSAIEGLSKNLALYREAYAELYHTKEVPTHD
jgi:hypothetical protein